MMKRLKWAAAAAVLAATTAMAQDKPAWRPPSVPLVVHNPYLSIWSNADKLTDDGTRHWTKKPQSLVSLIKVDGKSLRLMGNEPDGVGPLPQTKLTLLPTRTIYDFEGNGVHVTLSFVSPELPSDLDLMSRPLTYLVYDVKSVDGASHDVSIYFSASSNLAVNKTDQKVTWQHADVPGYTALKVGTEAQPVLQKASDDIRIDWGYALVAAPDNQSKGTVAGNDVCLKAFVGNEPLPADDKQMPRPVADNTPVMALTIDCGKVAGDVVERRAMIAYDDIYAVDFFGRKSRAFWRREKGMDGEKLLAIAGRQYDELLAKCKAFDEELMADTAKVGGENYSYICALAYRQCVGGCGLAADANGMPMFFTKENTSNGNMGTVDVLFPMDPIWVFLCPTLAKATVAPVMVYASSPAWQLPYAPHDLGEYPQAFTRASEDGKTDHSETMQVEESGNLVILADAIAHCDGNTKFIDPYWKTITRWVDFLEKFGPDPEEQLCTDDFNGRLAHNSNLGVKAIIGLGAYADLCRMRGDTAGYNKYINLARADAKNWMKQAGDGDHYKLSYDFKKPHSWSQLYNLAYDKVLGLEVFPKEVAEKEVAEYKTKIQPYGLPLDSRNMKTKTDWTVWSASLADNKEDFETLISPLVNYLQNTPERAPFTDGYYVEKLDGPRTFFRARPVIGGVYMRMLDYPDLWKKWAARDTFKPTQWAPLPAAPTITRVVPASQGNGNEVVWQYTFDKPADDWFKPEFDASKWKTGKAGFGKGAGGKDRRTEWSTDDIYIRREFTMPSGNFDNLKFWCFHDEDVEIYVNGVLAGTAAEYNTSYTTVDMTPAGRAALKPGRNLIAAHCHQTVGGQYIDVGIVQVTEHERN